MIKLCGVDVIYPGLDLRDSTVVVLPEHTGIKDHPIDLVDDMQLSYALPSCPPAPILFICKKNSSLGSYVNYRGFNSLTIKNWYRCL